jgi:large subunit ribosomal protein L30
VPPEATLKITQRRSGSHEIRSRRETLRSLGLGMIGRSVERQDTPVLRGMIRAVQHLVEVSTEPAEEPRVASKRAAKPGGRENAGGKQSDG